MVYAFQVDKGKFKNKLKEHYSPYIVDGNITLMRCYEMFCIDLGICQKTIYNFMNNKYSLKLLMRINELLNIEDIEEIFKEIDLSR